MTFALDNIFYLQLMFDFQEKNFNTKITAHLYWQCIDQAFKKVSYDHIVSI